jgi:dienelactone hydrolase
MEQVREIPRTQTFTRMLARGIDFTDYAKLKRRAEKKEDFVKTCEELGDVSLKHAMEEEARGHLITARKFYMKAAAVYRVSHYELLDYSEEKKRIYYKELDSFRKGIELHTDFSSEKVEVPYKSSKMVGWLMIPANAPEDVPVVICTGGMTGFKEEVHYVALSFLERGIAVLNVDGPGQGEAFYFHNCYLDGNTEDAHETLVDYLVQREDVGNRIALYGLCFGGYLMARAASKISDKIVACVSMGGAYELSTTLRQNPIFETIGTIRAGLAGSSQEEKMELISQLTLKGRAHLIQCPLLIIHNKPDYLISSDNIKILYEEAGSSEKELRYFMGPDHNAHNDNTESVSLAADWLYEKLYGGRKKEALS